MLDRIITAFANQTHVNNGLDISIRNTFDIIKSDRLKEKIEAIRNSIDPTIQSKLKDSLPKVTWNGTFSYRNSQGLKEYSGITAIDIDVKQDRIGDSQKLKETFAQDPCVLACFFTPRWGVKVIYTHDNTDPTLHKEMYAQLVEHVKVTIGNSAYTIDTSCSDISRVNNLSWDPSIYINPSPTPFHFDPTKVVKKEVKAKDVSMVTANKTRIDNDDGEKKLEDIDRMTCSCYNMFGQGERHSGLVFFAHRCVEYGIDYHDALLWAIDKFSQPGFNNEEIIKTINSIYKQ